MKKLVIGMALCAMSVCGLADEGKDDYTGFLLWPYAEESSFCGFALNVVGSDFTWCSGVTVSGIASRSDEMNGVALSLISTQAERRLSGFSLGGFGSGGGHVNGATMGGIVSAGTDLSGYAGSLGFANFDRVDGWQDGIVYSLSERVNGCQTSLVLAQCNDGIRGAQIAAVTFAGNKVDGLQLGLINVVGRELHGAQIGLINVAPGTLNLPIINCGSRIK